MTSAPFAPAPLLTRRALLRSAALAGAAAAGTAPFARAALAQSAGDWPAVEALIDEYVGAQKVACMVAALGFGQAEPDYIARGTLAFDSAAGVGPDTLFRIYSMTKPVTGMAAMMLIEEGRLGLDQPLAEILPAFAEMQVQKVYDGPITPDYLEPAVRPITIRHLLTHTAGLGYTIIQQGPISQAYRQAGLIPVAVSRLQAIPGFGGPRAPSLAVFADRLAQMPLVRQPGTRWHYSVSLDLLARVIEVAAGQPYDAFLAERLFEPCGMTSTWFTVTVVERARLATSYYDLLGVPLPIDTGANSIFTEPPAFPFGGAGLVSSARDYDRFLKMLAGFGAIEGRRVMSEAAVRLGTSNLLPDTLAPGGGFRPEANPALGFGAGGLVGTGAAAGLFGWFGAASTAGLVNLTYGLRHTLMTQLVTAEAEVLQSRFPLAVAQDAAAAAGAAAAVAASPGG